MILNLTQYQTTSAQAREGVVEPRNKAEIRELLTFEEVPSRFEMEDRADMLAFIAKRYDVDAVLIDGASYFMPWLERIMLQKGFQVFYSFSKREVVEEPDGRGGVRRSYVFRHIDFVEAWSVV